MLHVQFVPAVSALDPSIPSRRSLGLLIEDQHFGGGNDWEKWEIV